MGEFCLLVAWAREGSDTNKATLSSFIIQLDVDHPSHNFQMAQVPNQNIQILCLDFWLVLGSLGGRWVVGGLQT